MLKIKNFIRFIIKEIDGFSKCPKCLSIFTSKVFGKIGGEPGFNTS